MLVVKSFTFRISKWMTFLDMGERPLSWDKFRKLYDKEVKVASFLDIITLYTEILVVKSFTFQFSKWMSFLVMENYGEFTLFKIIYLK